MSKEKARLFMTNYKKIKKICSDTKFSCFWFESFEISIYVLILATIFMIFGFRIVSISGISMLDTLHNFDKVLIRRFNYKPKCGDVVVIKCGQYLDQPLIKRVIATEGQSLKVDYKNQSVLVDGVKIEEDYVKEPMIPQNDDCIPEIIPQGYCFVMGDNRNRSLDSRSGMVGLIENKNIIGKAMFIVFSFKQTGWIR